MVRAAALLAVLTALSVYYAVSESLFDLGLWGDVAFVGTTGVRRTGEVLDDTRVEVPVKRSLMASADRSVLLADRHKFPGTGALKVCDVAELDTVVTNPGLDDAMTALCADAGTELVLA